ncbi:polyprotein [Phytophthora megakarya]|uniref:RNA-directed DNA polymerase n=1 Tax=Phytophthora megakarya TaxID=4795 RepID=A0A225W407_9STRA|nr:polyprotein [Phytophthora megakarya]
MAATLQQQQSTSQQQQPSVPDSSSQDTREYRAEGITMPKFSAAAWYRWYVSHDGNFLLSVTQFEELLTGEFTTPDHQEHLHDQLLRLRQNNITCLEDYVSAFRHVICKVEDMSDIDKVMHFQKGFVVEIRQEVKLRQFRNTTDAISFALMYDRTHAVGSRRTRGNRGSQDGLIVEDNDVSDEDEDDYADSRDDHIEIIDSLQLNMVSIANEPSPNRELLRFEGAMNRQVVRVLIDSGAERNIVRPGLAHNYVDSTKVTAERFDGPTTPARTAQLCVETLHFADRDFNGVALIEWEVSPNQDMILGLPWLVQFNPVIDWQIGVMRFPNRCLVDDFSSVNDCFDAAGPTGASVEVNLALLQHQLSPNLRHQLNEHVKAGYFSMPLGPSSISALGGRPLPRLRDNEGDEDKKTSSLCVLSAVAFETKVKADEYVKLYNVTVKTSPKMKSVPWQLQAVLDEFADVFPVELPPRLPPSRSIEHEVVLKQGATPNNRAPFHLSKVEQEALDIFVAELLKKNWIEVSDPPWVSNIFGVPKKDPATEVAKIPLPHIEQLFDRMVGAVIFSILDLASGYHQMRMSPTSKQYTAFRTNHEIYHWNVAPMGLAGMPGTWTRLMRQLLSHLLFVVVYLDDICIFSQSMADHVEHLRQASIAEWTEPNNVKDLQRFLALAGYYRRFIHQFVTLVLPLSALVKKDVAWVWDDGQRQAFNAIKLALQHAPVLRLPDFDKPFIVTTDASHACIGGVLSQLHDGNDLPVAFFSKKLGQHELKWPVHEKEPFAIKQALTRWRHYLYGVSFEVYTDNSACKWFLQHPRLSGRLARWLDFFASFQFTLHHRPGALNVVADALSPPPECFFSPGEGPEDGDPNTEPMAVCAACLESPTCKNIRETVSGRTKAIEKLQSVPTRDQAVMLVVKQSAAQAHGVGTAQWRMRLHAASMEASTVISSLQRDTRTKRVFQKAYGKEASTVISSPQRDTRTKRVFQKAYGKDPVFKMLWKSGRSSKEYEIIRGLIYLKSNDSLRRLCVPNNRNLRLDVIRRTQLAAAQWYFWPSMDLDIKAYVQSCESCMRYKSSTGRRAGKLQPIPLPAVCWEVVSTDFITRLPVSDGFDAIMVVVDKLSKRPVYIPTYTTATAEDIAKVFFNNVIRYYGIPSTIISDRDPKFTSKFWKALVQLMKIKTAMTTAHRAQADGQTERQNRALEDSLRCSISYHGNDWNEHLSMIDAESDRPVASSRVEYASRFVQHRHEVIERARKNLLDAQEAQKKFYDQRRAANPFNVGDLALLSTQDLNISHATTETTLRSRKFIPRFIGPYAILELHGNVALLDLPANLKHISPRFNIDKLKVYNSNPDRFVGRVISKSTPVIFDDDGEPLHVVEVLIKKRIFNLQPEYLVKWHGLPHHENTWERERDIKHVSHWQTLLKDLRQRNRVAQD